MTTTDDLRDALVEDLHKLGYTHPSTAARLDALIAQVRQEARAGLVVWSRPGCIAFVDGVICGKDRDDFMHHDPDIPHGPLCHPYRPGTLAALEAARDTADATPAGERCGFPGGCDAEAVFVLSINGKPFHLCDDHAARTLEAVTPQPADGER